MIITKMTKEQIKEYYAQKERSFEGEKYCSKGEKLRAKKMSFDEMLISSNIAPLVSELIQVYKLQGK